MANRKINELSVRTPSLTDLMIVGDPSTGYSFKATLAALNTLIDSSTSIGDLNGVVITSPTNGQALVYDGTNWVNQSISVPVTSVFGRTGAVVATEGDYSLNLLSDVTLTSPSSNQVLQYNGTAWVNATLTDNGITSLNGLTAVSQTFATGSSGTDFAITSTTSTHTFNLPTASAVNRGALSSADWSTFNSKVGGSGTSGQVAYWTGTSSQSGSNNLFWDNANGRLGIGTNAPSNVLSVTSASNGNALRVEVPGTNNTIFDFYLGNSANTVYLRYNPYILEFRRAGQASTIKTVGGVLNDLALEANGNLTFFTNGANERMRVFQSTGNVLIQNGGTFTDGGQRLQVTGDVLFKGSGNTSGTTGLTVQNSDANAILQILNNGYLRLGTQGTSAFRIYPSSVASSGDVDINGLFLTLNSRVTTTETSTNAGFVHINGTIATATSGIQTILSIQKGFAPTSGTAAYNNILIASTINQTGGANGITRGLYVNPTLTAAADWRSIEWSNNSGWGLYGAGTANNYLAGSLGIGSTTLTNYTIRSQKPITGGVAGYGIMMGGQIQSDVTFASYYRTAVSTQAASFTLSELHHFFAEQGTFGASSVVTNQYGFVADASLINATNNFGFRGNIPSGTGRWNLYMNGTAANYMNGNLLLGSTTDGGQKLQVTGNAIVKGSGNTSATTALTVQNSDGNSFFAARNNESVEIGNLSGNRFSISSNGISFTNGAIIQSFTITSGAITLPSVIGVGVSVGGGTLYNIVTGGNNTNTTSSSGSINILRNFVPTSGSGVFTALDFSGTINQTGGANGITRGIYINPILTSAADWRSLEWSNNSGKGIWGVGTANNAMAGSLRVGSASNANASAILELSSTTKGFLPPVMTGAQAEAIASPATGLLLYANNGNGTTITTTGWWGYNGTTWVKLN